MASFTTSDQHSSPHSTPFFTWARMSSVIASSGIPIPLAHSTTSSLLRTKIVSLSAIIGFLLSSLFRACLLLPDGYLPDGELQSAGETLCLVRSFLAVEVIPTTPGTGDDFTISVFSAFLHLYYPLSNPLIIARSAYSLWLWFVLCNCPIGLPKVRNRRYCPCHRALHCHRASALHCPLCHKKGVSAPHARGNEYPLKKQKSGVSPAFLRWLFSEFKRSVQYFRLRRLVLLPCFASASASRL